MPSGQAATVLPLTFTGAVRRETGLARRELVSEAAPVTLLACLQPGDPGSGCARPTALPATVSADLVVRIAIGAAAG